MPGRVLEIQCICARYIKVGPESCCVQECKCYDSERGSVWIQRPLRTGEDGVCLLSVYQSGEVWLSFLLLENGYSWMISHFWK